MSDYQSIGPHEVGQLDIPRSGTMEEITHCYMFGVMGLIEDSHLLSTNLCYKLTVCILPEVILRYFHPVVPF